MNFIFYYCKPILLLLTIAAITGCNQKHKMLEFECSLSVRKEVKVQMAGSGKIEIKTCCFKKQSLTYILASELSKQKLSETSTFTDTTIIKQVIQNQHVLLTMKNQLRIDTIYAVDAIGDDDINFVILGSSSHQGMKICNGNNADPYELNSTFKVNLSSNKMCQFNESLLRYVIKKEIINDYNAEIIAMADIL